MAAARAVTLLREQDLEVLLSLIEDRTLPPDPYGCRRLTHTDQDGFSLNQKGYVQLRGTVVNNYQPEDPNPQIQNNTKFQLHQIIAYELATDENVPVLVAHPFQTYFGGGYTEACEISHLCRFKDCVERSHLFPEYGWINKSRIFCPVVININGIIHPCCKHYPSCISNAQIEQDAQNYNV